MLSNIIINYLILSVEMVELDFNVPTTATVIWRLDPIADWGSCDVSSN